jgi:hypothetical protein
MVMMKEYQKSDDDTYLQTLSNLRQVDVSTFVEVDIRAPAKVIWGYLTDERMAKYSHSTYSLESGSWGEIGSVIEVHPNTAEQGQRFPKTRQKITDSIPYKYFVYRMSSQISQDAIETFIGYDIVILQESNDMTKLMFVQPLAWNLSVATAEVPAFKEGHRRYIRTIFEDLKRLVESECRAFEATTRK